MEISQSEHMYYQLIQSKKNRGSKNSARAQTTKTAKKIIKKPKWPQNKARKTYLEHNWKIYRSNLNHGWSTIDAYIFFKPLVTLL